MYNFAVQNRDREQDRCRFFFLVASSDVPDIEPLAAYFNEHDLGTVVATPGNFSYLGELENRLFSVIPPGHSAASRVRVSLEYYNGLRYLQAKYQVELDVIEFPDFAAWGFATLGAKRAGFAFADTRIVVRLHSTQGIIYDAEPFYHPKGHNERSIIELERQCLEQADQVVSHLPVITRANQQYYGFAQDWMEKVVHEFPPIFLEQAEIFPLRGQPRNFIFSSRLQPFKRPDLFIKAAAIFLDRTVNFSGKFYLVSYGWDQRYIDWLKALVPVRHQQQIIFIFNAEANLRNRLLQESIVVIPSNYESLCVFAYESALRGSQLILNRRCAAFGEVDYWQDQENCLLFDGSAEHLADVYQQALLLPPVTITPLPDSWCYWHQTQSFSPHQTVNTADTAELAIVAYGFASLAQANELLLELATLLNDQQFSLHLILNHRFRQALAVDFPKNVQWHFCPWDMPNPDFIKALLGNLSAEYLAFASPDGKASPEFYRLASKVFNQHPELSLVTAHTRILKEEDLKNTDWQEGDRDDYAVDGKAKLTIGGAPSLVGIDMHIVSQYSCFRRDALDLDKIHEEAADFFLPTLLSHLLAKKCRTLVIPKLLITETPSQKAFLNETAVLHALSV